MPKLILRLEPLAEDDGPAPTRHVVDLGDHGRAATTTTPLARWSASVASAHDPCLVIDPQGRVLSLSAAAAELLGCSDGGVIGRQLLDVIDVVDFESGGSSPEYATRVAPLAVLSAGGGGGRGWGLMRSLLRVRHPDEQRVTVDASAAPLHDAHGDLIGSVTFLARVQG